MIALIIDDEIDICYLLTEILRKNNIQAYFVNTLVEADLVLKKQHPEFIFLDNHLPDGKGIDFVQQIRKKHPEAKVILITAYDTATDRVRAALEGVDFFIAKPFTRDTINHAVELFAKN